MKSTKQMEIDKNATMTTQEGEGEKEKSGKKSKNKNKEENVKGKEKTSNVMVDDHAKSRLEKKEKKKREKKNDTFSGCENERETKKRKKDHMMVYGKETEEKNEKEDDGDKEEEQKKGRMDAMKAENEEKGGKRRKEKKTKDDNEGKNKEKKSKKEKKDDVSNACENEREMKENDNEAFYEKKEKKAQKNKDDNGEKKKGKKCRKEKKDDGVEANNEEEREESMVKEKKMKDDNEEKKWKKSKKEKKDDNEEKKGKKSKKEKKDDNEEKKGKKTQDDNEEKKGKKRKKEKKDDVLSGCEDEREMKGKKDDIKANKEEKKRKEKEKKTQDDGGQKKKVKKVRFLDEVEVYPLADSSSKFKKTEEDGLVRGKRFTKEEDEMIKKAVSDYIEANHLGEEGLDMVLHCKRHSKIRNCWKEIATALPWRPYVSIYLRAHALYERGDNKWTPEELQQVREAHAKYGNHWKKTADELGKFRVHVKDAYRRIKLIDMKKGHWSQDEYQTLFELVNKDLQMKLHEEKKSKFGMLRDNISWDAISDKLSTRHNSACCVKWYNQLTSPMVAEGKWSDVDDYKLVMKLVELDASCEDEVDWENLIEYRSADLSRSRWQQMVRHLGVHGTKSFPEQVEVLSQRYCPNMLEVREALDAKPIVDSS